MVQSAQSWTRWILASRPPGHARPCQAFWNSVHQIASCCDPAAPFFPTRSDTVTPIWPWPSLTMARGSLLPLLAVATLVALATQLLDTVFVGSVGSQARTSLVPRSVGVDYLLRNGPKDADPPLINTASAAGPSHEVRSKNNQSYCMLLQLFGHTGWPWYYIYLHLHLHHFNVYMHLYAI